MPSKRCGSCDDARSPDRSGLQERISHVKTHRTVNLNVDGCSRHFVAPDILDLDFLGA
jgi:hypothetical protein